jgi:iron complex transport system substrate-binding protein
MTRRLAFLSIFLLCLSSAGSGEDGYPRRIVSLGSSLTEEVFLLGCGDRLVGVTIYCERPPAAKEKEKVGTVVEVDLERIVNLKPDLILATSLTDPRDKERLKDLGIRLVEFPYARDFSQVCEKFMELAALLGKEEEGWRIVREAKGRVEAVKERVKNLPRPKVFVQIGMKPLHTVTEESFIGDFIEFAGGVNVARASKSSLYSREQVVRDNPDVIIITTMGMAGQSEKEAWQKFKTINAVKDSRIYIIDAYRICSPTPVTFAEELEEIAGLLHPGQGKEI